MRPKCNYFDKDTPKVTPKWPFVRRYVPWGLIVVFRTKFYSFGNNNSNNKKCCNNSTKNKLTNANLNLFTIIFVYMHGGWTIKHNSFSNIWWWKHLVLGIFLFQWHRATHSNTLYCSLVEEASWSGDVFFFQWHRATHNTAVWWWKHLDPGMFLFHWQDYTVKFGGRTNE